VLIIDAYNVLHLPEAAADERAATLDGLARLIAHARTHRQRVLLVCDGTGDGSIPSPNPRGGRVRHAGIEVLFSGPDRSADDEIERRLRAGAGAGVTVVSDDKRLRRAAARVRAKAHASRPFLLGLLRSADRPGAPLPAFARDIPLDPYAVDHWMRTFGLSPDDLVRHTGLARAARPAAPARPEPDAPPAKPPAPRPKGMHRTPATPTPPGPIPPGDLEEDPVIREAMRAWRLRREDLDMARWLDLPPADRP
jgi:hypothetical protein